MPSLSPILDVVIGLAGVYAAFSLLASWANEQIASMLKWRAAFLLAGLKRILNGDAGAYAKFTSDPMFQALKGVAGSAKLKNPSYMSAQQFSTILMHVLSQLPGGPDLSHLNAAQTVPGTVQATTQMSSQYMAAISAAAKAFGVDGQLNALLLRAGGDVDKFVKSVEDWYDAGMDRVSGWYKRRAQIAIFVIGCVLAIAFNVDTIRLYDGLTCNQALRTSVLTFASASPDQRETYVQNLVNAVPLGWPAWPGQAGWLNGIDCKATASSSAPASPSGAASMALKLIGLLLTAIALSLGAPFWFDTLSKLTRVRNAGKKPDAPSQK